MHVGALSVNDIVKEPAVFVRVVDYVLQPPGQLLPRRELVWIKRLLVLGAVRIGRGLGLWLLWLSPPRHVDVGRQGEETEGVVAQRKGKTYFDYVRANRNGADAVWPTGECGLVLRGLRKHGRIGTECAVAGSLLYS